jgi:predicted pyridoxine 5'-phosphate oxidase superfamily flavin-nucleotide-binding protein
MELTADLPDDRRARVEARLRTNLMAWLTTVSPAGRPNSVPVWFLMRDDNPPADQVPDYVAKYTERIGAIFGTAEHFAREFSEATVIAVTRLHA